MYFQGLYSTSVENLEFLEFVYFSFKAWPWMGGGGVLDLSWGRGVPPGPRNPDPVYDKKFVKIVKN